jgi:hypothetical protein
VIGGAGTGGGGIREQCHFQHSVFNKVFNSKRTTKTGCRLAQLLFSSTNGDLPQRLLPVLQWSGQLEQAVVELVYETMEEMLLVFDVLTALIPLKWSVIWCTNYFQVPMELTTKIAASTAVVGTLEIGGGGVSVSGRVALFCF